MQIEKLEVQAVHNLVLTTLLPSHQVKHLAFLRLDAPKTLLFKEQELKLVTGLAIATHSTLTLYAVYEQAQALMLGQWRLHEDITGLVGWDRVVIVTTAQRVVGFRYEGGFLRNSFMVSLQFLPLEERDVCRVQADRMGCYFVMHIRNYLIFCFSETVANKYKSRIVQKEKIEIIGEEVRWNDPQAQKPYILDMVKIKVADLGVSGLQQLRLVDDTVYFLGYRGKETVLHFIQIYYFFSNQQKPGQEMIIASALPLRDQPPPNTKIVINHNRPFSSQHSPDLLYHTTCAPYTLTLRSQQNIYEIATYNSPIEILPLNSTMFPIVVWQSGPEKFSVIQRFKTFQDSFEFKHSELASDVYAQTVIYRQGLVVTASKTEVILLTCLGQQKKIHESLGGIIEVHVGKELLFIENPKKKETRLWEMSRGPRVDPRPFVTHKKKMFLQQMNQLKALYSIMIGETQILAAKIGSSFKFFKEGAEFQAVLEPASQYFQILSPKGESCIVLKKTDCKGGLLCQSQEGSFKLEGLEWEGWTMDKRWCLDDYLIARSGSNWSFFNVFTKVISNFVLPIDKLNNVFINCFFSFRTVSQDKQTKDHPLVELYLCYNKLLEIWLLNLKKGQKKLIYRAMSVGEGSPILTNELFAQQIQPYLKDRWRSITCPEYSLSEQSIRTIYNKEIVVIGCHFYQSQKKVLLLMVTSEQQLLIYRKYFNLDQCGFLFRRVSTPLNVVKNFSYNEDKSFKDLGQGVVKAGNFLLYKGELLENSTMTSSARSLFKMEGRLWGLLVDGRIRQVQLGSSVTEGFWLKQIDCGFKEELMGIQSASDYYCVYSRKGFEIFSKQLQSHWKCQLGNETIVTVKLFDHFVGVSYYDYYRDEEGVSQYESVRFRFRIYNCATKNKVLEREKALDEPILHIRYMPPEKLLLVTSSVIFINLFKNDKSQLEPFRAHNFTAKRSFITAFAHIPDILPNQPGAYGSPTYMLFGGSHGGLGFFVGKWVEEQKLKEQWFEGFRCPIRHACFFHFGQEQEQQLKALIVDEESNLMVLALKKDHAEKIVDMRLPGRVNSIKSKSGQGFVVFSALDDGSIRLLTTVKLDNSQDGFLDFQNVFCRELPFVGGFNFRWSRQLQQQYRSGRLVSKGDIIDGDLLEQFFSMTDALQHHISQECEMQISLLKGALPF